MKRLALALLTLLAATVSVTVADADCTVAAEEHVRGTGDATPTCTAYVREVVGQAVSNAIKSRDLRDINEAIADETERERIADDIRTREGGR